MIRVRFAHPDFGDKDEQMSVQQTVKFIEDNEKSIGIGRWAESDQALVLDRTGLPFLDTADLTRQIKQNDGQELVLYPKVAGG